MAGLTLDSGALIGFERHDREVMAQVKAALLAGRELAVPAVVVAEVWRGGARSAAVARLLAACDVVPIDEALGRAAGEALARVARAGAIDALVMAVAEHRKDMVLTSDETDLRRLQGHFPSVTVVAIGAS